MYLFKPALVAAFIIKICLPGDAIAECKGTSVSVTLYDDSKYTECLVPSSNTSGFKIKRASGKDAESISAPFKEFLNLHFAGCVAEALDLPQEKISNIVAVSWGIAGDATHKPQSLHSVRRALDVYSISYTYGGKKFKQIMSRQKHKNPFYEKFLACWDKAIETRGSPCAATNEPGESCVTRRSSIGFDDCYDMFTGKGHDGHIHLAYPFCEDDQEPTALSSFWFK
jgi:hypothetical protein